MRRREAGERGFDDGTNGRTRGVGRRRLYLEGKAQLEGEIGVGSEGSGRGPRRERGGGGATGSYDGPFLEGGNGAAWVASWGARAFSGGTAHGCTEDDGYASGV